VSAAGISTLVLAVVAPAASAADAAPPAAVTVVAPGNGTLVEGAPRFSWRIDAPTDGPVTVTHQLATDLAVHAGRHDDDAAVLRRRLLDGLPAGPRVSRPPLPARQLERGRERREPDVDVPRGR
jgi:hypothetical protein